MASVGTRADGIGEHRAGHAGRDVKAPLALIEPRPDGIGWDPPGATGREPRAHICADRTGTNAAGPSDTPTDASSDSIGATQSNTL